MNESEWETARKLQLYEMKFSNTINLLLTNFFILIFGRFLKFISSMSLFFIIYTSKRSVENPFYESARETQC